MTRGELRGRVQTVTGLIDPGDLGATLMHEHLLCDITPPRLAAQNVPDPVLTLENYFDLAYGRVSWPAKYKLVVPALIAEEIARMRQAGGRSVVELTCNGLKPQPEALAAIARQTGVNIVMGCGWYVEDYQPAAVHALAVEDFAAGMIARLLHEEVRAGIIGEIGCQAPWTALERRVMQGALLAQQETGAAINVHPGRHPDQPQEVADFIRAAGADPGRIIISHVDRTIFDETRLLRLADSGVVIEFDLFGQETTFYPNADIDMPNDGTRLHWIRRLIAHGHLDRIVISHDICYCTRLQKFGGHGYGHIYRNVLPLMRSRGFSEAEIETIMVRTPARLLTFI